MDLYLRKEWFIMDTTTKNISLDVTMSDLQSKAYQISSKYILSYFSESTCNRWNSHEVSFYHKQGKQADVRICLFAL